MNDDQIKQEAAKWLVSLRETAEQASGFVLDQAPGAMREFVTLGRAEHTLYFVLGLIALAVVARVSVLTCRYIAAKEVEPWHIPLFIVMLFGSLASVVAICNHFHPMLTAWFAPRIYIIETLAELAGKVAGK